MESHRVRHDWINLAASAATRGNIWLCFPKVPRTEGMIAGVLFLPFVFITHILWACVSMCQAKLRHGNCVPDSLLFLTYDYFKNTHIALLICQADLCSSAGKESACNAGDLGLISRLGRYPGGRCGNPLQYCCLKNPIDRGAWRAMVHKVTKSQTRLRD